ncbi:hypothetical protein GCM10009101_16370 [Brevundimonas lenta]
MSMLSIRAAPARVTPPAAAAGWAIEASPLKTDCAVIGLPSLPSPYCTAARPDATAARAGLSPDADPWFLAAKLWGIQS